MEAPLNILDSLIVGTLRNVSRQGDLSVAAKGRIDDDKSFLDQA